MECLPSATEPAGGVIPEGAAFVEVVSGQHVIAVNAQLDSALDASTLDTAAAIRFSGHLSGTGSLVLSGEGSVTLSSNDNSYTGGTTVDGGTLYLDDSRALANGSSLTVGAGGSQVFNQLLEAARIEPAAAARWRRPSRGSLNPALGNPGGRCDLLPGMREVGGGTPITAP